jgi:adenylate cyclase
MLLLSAKQLEQLCNVLPAKLRNIVQSVPLSNENDRLNHMLLAYVRQEFEAPVSAIVGYSEIMIEDAQQQGHQSFLNDLRRLHQAAVKLKQLVLGLLDPTPINRDFTDFRQNLRHDLRTPISAIKGLGEMLLEDAQAQGNAAQVRDLEKLLATTVHLLAQIDALIDFGGRTLPATTVDRPGSETVSAVLKPVPALPSFLARYQATPSRILIVDDTDATRELLARRLGREGHHVVEVSNGRAALDRVVRETFDLILLDMMMPDLNGYEVLTELKANVHFRHIPVIVISALDEIDSVVRCIEAGAEDYLSKPFDPVLLRARIGASLEKVRLRESEQAAVAELRAEKERSETLLRNILPRSIITRMHRGETPIADRFHDVTILFSDIVGFTGISMRRSASDVVALLDAIFSTIDRLALEYGIEKIKTIGDAYMAVAGLPEPRDDHPQAIARLALAMRKVVGKVSQSYGEDLRIRIGFHSGNVVAGVIGMHKFAYDVWGDTVNTASAMESRGIPNEIQVSQASFMRLSDQFVFERRGTIEIKGNQHMETYLLRSER